MYVYLSIPQGFSQFRDAKTIEHSTIETLNTRTKDIY